MIEIGNPFLPFHYAWLDATTYYGKVGVILFYVLIWFNIVSALWTLIDPASQGGQCLINSIPGDDGQQLFIATFRIAMIVTVGFFLYANELGFRVRNVARVAVVVSSCCAIGVQQVKRLGCGGHVDWYASGPLAWSALVLLLAVLESRAVPAARSMVIDECLQVLEPDTPTRKDMQ